MYDGGLFTGGHPRKWPGMRGAKVGDVIGLLLDLSNSRGTLCVFLNGQLLGPLLVGIATAPLRWAVDLGCRPRQSGGSARIETKEPAALQVASSRKAAARAAAKAGSSNAIVDDSHHISIKRAGLVEQDTGADFVEFTGRETAPADHSEFAKRGACVAVAVAGGGLLFVLREHWAKVLLLLALALGIAAVGAAVMAWRHPSQRQRLGVYEPAP